MSTASNVTQLETHEKRVFQTVPWADFESYFNQLRTSLTVSGSEVCRLLGYSANAHSGWRGSHEVPTVAFHAIKWLLHDRKIDVKKPKPVTFSKEELQRLFALSAGIPIPESEKKPLVLKLTAAISASYQIE